MIHLTVEGILALRPCPEWTRDRLEGLFAGRSYVTLEEAVRDERVPIEDATWLITRILPEVGVRFMAVVARWACLRTGWRDPRSAWACRSAYAGEMTAVIRDDAYAAAYATAHATASARAAYAAAHAAARAADAADAADDAAHSADADALAADAAAHVSYAVVVCAEDVGAADANAAMRAQLARMVRKNPKGG